MGMFLLILQKIPVSLSFIVTEIWPGQNTNLKIVVFWPKLLQFLTKLNFIFLLHNFSRYVIYGFFFHFFSMKGSWRYGSDKGSVTHGHTDGRTYTEGRTIYVSRRGIHIISVELWWNICVITKGYSWGYAKYFSESAPSYITIKYWCAEFRHGRENTEDDPQPGHPSDVVTPETVQTVKDSVLKHRHLIIRQLDLDLHGIG